MKTDWNLVREMIGAAIDVCERIEATGYTETDRDAVVNVEGQEVSVHDFLVSAWTLPETVRYSIIRQRHDDGNDLFYVPETARIIVATAKAAAELIGSGGPEAPASGDTHKMIDWFRNRAAPGIEKAIAQRRRGTA